MTSAQLEIQLVAVVVAVACALPGVFLVLRRLALVSDAISHAVLLGIVLAFFAVGDLSSPLLLVGAAATGLLTVFLIELLQRTRLVREDAAIGLVFPALFSVGVILIARFADTVHLDTDVVLLGELAFAPFERFVLFGWDWGPEALVEMGFVLALNVLVIALLYKELKLATFDPGLALALGFSPALLHYGLMALVSITAVGAFDAVGSILVVALMVGPPAAAYLLTDRLPVMLGLAALGGAASAVGGFWLAHALDASIAGSIAAVVGIEFGAAVLFAPKRGVVALARRHARQRVEFAEAMLAIHLLQHEGTPEALAESRVDHLDEHLRWERSFARRVVRRAERRGYVVTTDGRLLLTDRGRALARTALAV
ncbi:MAG: metal ABC transporter permease [Thermoleophilia bacterium]|nr:metal ABC transporter permease [Thermoleophilia bacterium]